MKPKSVLVITLICSPIILNAFDGYRDSLGNFLWIDSLQSTSFTDSLGKAWYHVTADRRHWEEALTIYRANLLAFHLLGVDTQAVKKDLFLFKGDSPLFTKLSHLRHPDLYITDWKPAFNSDTGKKTAFTSSHIKIGKHGTRLVMKFYPQKGKIPRIQALGLVKKGFIAHNAESAFELIEQIWKKIWGIKDVHADPLSDMHTNNCSRLLKKFDKKSTHSR